MIMSLAEERVRQAVHAELADVGLESYGCPHIADWIAHYRQRSAAEILRSIHRYTGRNFYTVEEMLGALERRTAQAARSWQQGEPGDTVPSHLRRGRQATI